MKNNYLVGNISLNMHIKYLNVLIFLFLGIFTSVYSQNESWFYIRAKTELFTPKFERINDLLVYRGADQNLKNILSSYSISDFNANSANEKTENPISIKPIKDGNGIFYCPMHCEGSGSAEEGECPKCGMA